MKQEKRVSQALKWRNYITSDVYITALSKQPKGKNEKTKNYKAHPMIVRVYRYAYMQRVQERIYISLLELNNIVLILRRVIDQ